MLQKNIFDFSNTNWDILRQNFLFNFERQLWFQLTLYDQFPALDIKMHSVNKRNKKKNIHFLKKQ